MYIPGNLSQLSPGEITTSTPQSSIGASTGATTTSFYGGFFHWSTRTGDTLWISGWIPRTESVYIGACIGLISMAMVYRGLKALEIYHLAWATKKLCKRTVVCSPAIASQTREKNEQNMRVKDDDDATSYRSAASSLDIVSKRKSIALHMFRSSSETLRRSEIDGSQKGKEYYPATAAAYPCVPNLSWKSSIIHGILTTVQTFIAYLLVMVIMTGNLAYVISILAGTFGGELIFCQFQALTVATKVTGSEVSNLTQSRYPMQQKLLIP